MITGDLNTALVPWVVQYRIADPKQYLFGAREPEKTLRDLITFVSLLFGFITIPTNSVGVKLRFGAYHSTEGPGLAYAIPYIDEITLVPTQRLLKLEFGFSTPQATNQFQGDQQPEDTETMITGDLNTALVPWVVQYRITDPKQYLFGAREPEKTLRDLSESVMREVIGDRTVDEVLTIE